MYVLTGLELETLGFGLWVDWGFGDWRLGVQYALCGMGFLNEIVFLPVWGKGSQAVLAFAGTMCPMPVVPSHVGVLSHKAAHNPCIMVISLRSTPPYSKSSKYGVNRPVKYVQ